MTGGRKIPPSLPILVSILLTLVLLVIAAGGCGVGHGHCSWIVYFLPALTLFAKTGLMGGFGTLLSLIQFPLYAVILSAGIRKQRTKAVAIGLVAFHLLAVGLALLVLD